jgi:hypothetical protein
MNSPRIAGFVMIFAALGCGADVPASFAVPAPEDTAEQHEVANETDGGFGDPATPPHNDGKVEASLSKKDLEITIRRVGGLGYCPMDGMVLSARLTSADAVFQGTRATAGDPEGEDCLEPLM